MHFTKISLNAPNLSYRSLGLESDFNFLPQQNVQIFSLQNAQLSVIAAQCKSKSEAKQALHKQCANLSIPIYGSSIPNADVEASLYFGLSGTHLQPKLLFFIYV